MEKQKHDTENDRKLSAAPNIVLWWGEGKLKPQPQVKPGKSSDRRLTDLPTG
jgi:hypothetical protein